MNEQESTEEKQTNEHAQTYSVTNGPTPHIVHVKKSPAKKILLALCILLLIGVSAGVGYLYYQEMTKTADLQTSITQKDSEITALKAAQQATPPNTTYTATVGKFTLTLDAKYYIIKNLDDVYEGGPMTSLMVAVANESGTNVIDNTITKQLTIEAWPKSAFASGFDSFVGIQLEGTTATKGDATKIADVQAQTYVGGEITTSKYLFFEKNNNMYKITMNGVNEAGEDATGVLAAVIKGFTFSE